MNTDKPPIEEPSVLDYLKSKLKFWERHEEGVIPEGTEPVAQPDAVAVVADLPQETAAPRRPWPWRSLFALALALGGQYAFEPPNRAASTGLVLYFISAAFLVWAVLVKECVIAPLPESEPGDETLKVRRLPFLLSIPLAVLAFLTFAGNKFTLFNVTIWALTIICFLWAFWIPNPDATPLWRRLKAFFARDSWPILVTRWTLLLLAVTALVVFFRVYRLNGVPAEPSSDHAEKILDLYDITQGQTHIFFPRNSGREGLQMYLTIVVAWIFDTGLSFLSLKIGTVLCGLAALPYMYLLGKELGGKRIGLLAVLLAGIAYWPNVISRAGLRFPLYPLFTAAVLYHLIRGLRTQNRNDFILAGLALGLGLHGYSSFRIMPIVVVVIFGTYLLHLRSKDAARKTAMWLLIVASIALLVFLPLLRYMVDSPETVTYRSLTRLTDMEQPLPGPAWQVLLSNLWNALRMFNWDNGEVWAHSVPHRPALDVVSAALFLIGGLLVLIRYIQKRHWQDLLMLVSIPLLELPSILSLAFPAENPDLYRTGGALVPAFLVAAFALDGLLVGIESKKNRTTLSWGVMGILVILSIVQNYDLVFYQFDRQYRQSAENSSEMGQVISDFRQMYGTTDSVWIVPYPYWVDTRLPGVWIGVPNKDFALWPHEFGSTLDVAGAKLFILKPEDTQDLDALVQLYPQGVVSTFHSAVANAGKDFLTLFVPPVR